MAVLNMDAKVIAKELINKRTDIIAQYATGDDLRKIDVSEGVTITQGPDGMLEVVIAPFSKHGNHWPTIAFGPRYFEKPINLASYSKLEVVMHHMTEGMSLIDLNIATLPDGTKNVDYEQYWIPGQTAMPATMSMASLINNDPSEISLVQIIFRPREQETVYRIEPIKAFYDPSIGSPAEQLQAKAEVIRQRYDEVKQELLASLSSSQGNAVRETVDDLDIRVQVIERQIDEAAKLKFYKSYKMLSQQLDSIASEIGRLRMSRVGPMVVYEPNRYTPIERSTSPELTSKIAKQFNVQMAGNEFRDLVFTVFAADHDLEIDLSLEPTASNPIPSGVVQLYQVAYLNNFRGEETGDALLPVNGKVKIPKGEGRQFWVRFNTRTSAVKAGLYTFAVQLRDRGHGISHTIPGQLEVWPFTLPSYDILPNNSYAIFNHGVSDDPTGQKFRDAIREMKTYGLNYLYMEPPEIPITRGFDEQWMVTSYDDAAFKQRIESSLQVWRQSPGDEKLNFIIALLNYEMLGMESAGGAFLDDAWQTVLKQYLEHLKSVLKEAGVADDQWILMLRDESSQAALIQYDIPMAEAIRRIDPSIRIISNSSALLSDTQWTKRYFDAFDMFQPHRGRDQVIQWLRQSGKPIWLYECDTGMTAMGRDLYDYYRVYGWEMVENQVVGTGVWTYFSSTHNRPWGEDFQGCQLIYVHPEQGIVHSRRYEMYREGMDDYRYVAALREAAKKHGDHEKKIAETLIRHAISDIQNNLKDQDRCEAWRVRIAEQILALKAQ